MKTVFCLLLIFTRLNIFSQSSISLGIKAGISLPNVTFENTAQNTDIEIKNNIGFNGGIFVDIFSLGRFILSSDLYFNQSFVNAKARSSFSQTINSVDYKVEYLSYALLPKYYIIKKVINPYIFAGPNLTFYIDNRPTSATYSIPEGELISITDNINKVIFSVVLGAGVDFKTSKKTSIFVESQFAPGIMNTYSDGDVSAKTKEIQVKTGFKIKF